MTTAGKKSAPVDNVARNTAAEKLYDATAQVTIARSKLADMQKQYAPGTAAYAQCEAIDDDLHEALTLLGQ